MSESVLLSIDDAVATVTLNRPDRLNALDLDLANALHDTMLTVERDSAVWVVVLRGAGKGFMASWPAVMSSCFTRSSARTSTARCST